MQLNGQSYLAKGSGVAVIVVVGSWVLACWPISFDFETHFTLQVDEDPIGVGVFVNGYLPAGEEAHARDQHIQHQEQSSTSHHTQLTQGNDFGFNLELNQ